MDFMTNSWQFVLYISFNFLNQFFVNFERSDHILLNHYFLTFIYIHTLRGAGDLATLHVVPAIVVNFFNFDNFVNSRFLSEHHGEGAGCLAAADEDVGLAGGHVGALVAVEAEVGLRVDGGLAEDVEGAGAEVTGEGGEGGVLVEAAEVVIAGEGGEGGGGEGDLGVVVVGYDDDGCGLGYVAALAVEGELGGVGVVGGGVGAGVLVGGYLVVGVAAVEGGPVVLVGGLAGGEGEGGYVGLRVLPLMVPRAEAVCRLPSSSM